MIRGRDFDAPAREDRSAIIIGATTAARLWGKTDPIGRRLVSFSPTRRGSTFTVVGVVDETRAGLAAGNDEIHVFVPDVRMTGHFLVRTEAPAQPMQATVRAIAVAEAPGEPLVSVRTLEAIETTQRTSVSRAMAGVGTAGSLAFFLSAIGLYAVVAFAVGQRVREIGIRTALGAGRHHIVRGFLMRGVRLCAAGLVVGLSLSTIVIQVMASARAEDPPERMVVLTVGIAGLAVAVALLATWIPARRAARVDPVLALRAE